MFKRLFKKKKIEVKIFPAANRDLIGYIRDNKDYFIKFEEQTLSKSKEEVEMEFELGNKILNLDLKETFEDKQPIVFIPPKYEFWPHLFLAIKLVKLGYSVHLLYFPWAKKTIDLISAKTNYVDYHGLKFSDIDDYHIDSIKDSLIINMSESFSGIKATVPSFSTVYIKNGSDLDHASAYIIEHAFRFAGLKKSSIKRVIIDKEIEEEFIKKINQKLSLGKLQNASFIKSPRIMDEIRELVSEAISDGAELHSGDAIINSDDLPKNIVLSGIKPEMRIYQKKFFGPVLLISSVEGDANSTLEKLLKMQPSKGIVIFTENEIEKISNLPDDLDFIYRTSSIEKDVDLLNDHPSLEFLIEKLKIK